MKMKMKRCKTIGCIMIMIIIPALSGAQVSSFFEITSPPSPVGSGARAMGTGGAFIAIADDATAASWNPAALIQLETPEASAVFTQDQRDTKNNSVEFYDVNYLSASYPFTLFGKNMIFSANYQRLFDFYSENSSSQSLPSVMEFSDAEFLFPEGFPIVPPPEHDVIVLTQTEWTRDDLKMESEQTGEIGALAPAYAIQITPSFSLGITWNFWRDAWIGEGYKQEYDEEGTGITRLGQALWYDTDGDCTCNDGGVCDMGDYVDCPDCVDELVTGEWLPGPNPDYSSEMATTYNYSSEQTIEIEGQNLNMGFLWNFGRWTLGGVYRTEFTADVDRKVEITREQTGFNPQPETDYEEDYDEKLTFPASYGLGLAFRYSDSLTFTTDVTQVEWNRFLMEYENGDKISPVNGLVEDEADIDPTITMRAGMEYLYITPKYVVPFRVGYFYDPQPARKHPDIYRGFTLGTGLAYKSLVLDAAFYYRWGDDVTVATTTTGDHETLLGEEDGNIRQQMVMLSAIFHFE